ncbi:transposase [Halopseudomonas pelagia]|uniref:transposase n=1 Tax=Halopseudomonas pelagia TaxID=553151 RepID=UPI003C6D03F7
MLRLVAFRALVLQILYSVPTQQHLEDLVRYNLLLRWFYGEQYLLFEPPSSAEIEEDLRSIRPEDNIGNLLAGVVEMAEAAAAAPPDKHCFTPDHALLARWCSRH